MQEIVTKELCSGCNACYSSCPQKCISMISDEEGFLYPCIDNDKCINCNRCKKVCPVLNNNTRNLKGEAFACVNKNEDIRLKSSSGGIFTLLAEKIIEAGGVVFGAAFDKDLSVHHIAIKEKADINMLRGSKYLQSTIGNCYLEAETYLKDGQLVLFSGTPCQIRGLRGYLYKDYPNLITQDIICHGVPSPLVWQKYLSFLQNKFKSSADRKLKPLFRSKITGWREYSINVNFENGIKHTKKANEDLYMKSFLKNLSLRESCYNCHSKSLERESDITLADFWGVEKILPEMDDNLGVSLVILNSPKGSDLFVQLKNDIKFVQVDLDKAISFNKAAIQSCPRPNNRNTFIKNTNSQDFKTAVRKGIDEKLIFKLKKLLKRLIKGAIKYVQK